MPNNEIITKIEQTKFLTQAEKKILVSMFKHHDAKEVESDEKKPFLFDMSIVGDKKFSSNLSSFINSLDETFSSEKEILKNLQIISHEMKYMKNVDSIILKAKVAINLMNNNVALEEHEKLTIAEISVLRKAQKISKYIRELSEEIPGFTIKKATVDLSDIDKVMKDVLTKLKTVKLYKTGDILVTDISKADAAKLKKTSYFDKIKGKISKYKHAAQILDMGDSVNMSHMWEGKHILDKLELTGILQSEIYRIDVTKLVQEKDYPAFIAKFGENWRDKLQEKFQKKIYEVTGGEAFDERIQLNSDKLAFEAVLPHFVGRNKNQTKGLFKSSNNDQSKELLKTEMICSEFVLRETVEALDELNKELSHSGLKVDSPFDVGVNPSRVTPEGLIDLLKQKSCLTKVESREIEGFVNTRNNFHTIVKKELALNDLIYKKIECLYKKKMPKEEFLDACEKAVLVYLTESASKNGHQMNDKMKDELKKSIRLGAEDLYNEKSSKSVSFKKKILKLIKSIRKLFVHKDPEIQKATLDFIEKLSENIEQSSEKNVSKKKDGKSR